MIVSDVEITSLPPFFFCYWQLDKLRIQYFFSLSFTSIPTLQTVDSALSRINPYGLLLPPPPSRRCWNKSRLVCPQQFFLAKRVTDRIFPPHILGIACFGHDGYGSHKNGKTTNSWEFNGITKVNEKTSVKTLVRPLPRLAVQVPPTSAHTNMSQTWIRSLQWLYSIST